MNGLGGGAALAFSIASQPGIALGDAVTLRRGIRIQ